MECPRCGTTNDNTRQFCSNCGTPIASNMLDPIDFGKTQANPVVVTPIEPMSHEEKLRNTSVIPVVSEEVQAEIPIDLEEEKEKELERTAIRQSLIENSKTQELKLKVNQIEKVKSPKKKKPVGTILLIVLLFLICGAGIIYYLLSKEIIKMPGQTTTVETTTTTKVDVKLDTELRSTSNEIIVNSTSHILKYSYEITKTETGYSPVIKVFLDNNQVSEAIVQNNSYELNELYTAVLRTNIFTIEEQMLRGSDKEYYYINIFINEKYYVLILNDTSCIYTNTTGMFTTKDPDYIYNNKSSLIKNGQYAYIKERDETSGLEQLATLNNDTVTFTDGEVIGGFWK